MSQICVYLVVTVVQGSMSNLAGCLWLRLSYGIAAKLSVRATVSPEGSTGRGSCCQALSCWPLHSVVSISAAGLPQGQQPGESEEASAWDERHGLLIPSSQKWHLIASAGLCSLKVSHTTQPLLRETDYTRAWMPGGGDHQDYLWGCYHTNTSFYSKAICPFQFWH